MWALAYSTCFGCQRLFAYNPMRVPSIRIKNQREPICLDCVNAVNPMRIKKGLEPIVPHPEAYEPCTEEELRD